MVLIPVFFSLSFKQAGISTGENEGRGFGLKLAVWTGLPRSGEGCGGAQRGGEGSENGHLAQFLFGDLPLCLETCDGCMQEGVIQAAFTWSCGMEDVRLAVALRSTCTTSPVRRWHISFHRCQLASPEFLAHNSVLPPPLIFFPQ